MGERGNGERRKYVCVSVVVVTGRRRPAWLMLRLLMSALILSVGVVDHLPVNLSTRTWGADGKGVTEQTVGHL